MLFFVCYCFLLHQGIGWHCGKYWIVMFNIVECCICVINFKVVLCAVSFIWDAALLLNGFLHCQATLQCYIDVACCYRQNIVVCLLVCLSRSLVSPAKTAKPIEMPFVMLSRVDPRKHVLDGVQFPTREGQFWKGGLVPHSWRGSFERGEWPAEDFWQSICSKWLSRGIYWYGADADWDVLDDVY